MNRTGTVPLIATLPMHRNLHAVALSVSRLPVALLLLAGWLHSAAARLPDIWGHGTDAGPAGPVGPLELLILAIAVAGTMQMPPMLGRGASAAVAAMLLLIPSTLTAGTATLVFAVWAAVRSHGAARAGALLFAGLSACGLWWVLGERLIGSGILNIDAMAVEGVLGSLVPEVERTGNVVGIFNGHRIVVLAGCSTLNALPLIVLGLAALSLRQGRLPSGFAWRAVAVAVVYAAANIARLTILATSAQLYHIGHGPEGMMAFDALATLLPLLLATRPEARPEPLQVPPSAIAAALTLADAWRALGFALLLLAGLAVMAAHVAAPPGPSREARAKAAVTTFLRQAGWQPMGESNISTDGTTSALLFAHPGCPVPLVVAVAGRVNEAVSMVQAALGPQTRWLYAGRLTASAPAGNQTWLDLWSAAAVRLGLADGQAMPLLAIARAPADGDPNCILPADNAWLALASLPD